MSPRKLSTEMTTTFRSEGSFGPASTTGFSFGAVDEAIELADKPMTDASCVASGVFRLQLDKRPAKAATQHHDTKIRPPCPTTRIVTFNPKTLIKTQGPEALLQCGYGNNVPHHDTFFLAGSLGVL